MTPSSHRQLTAQQAADLLNISRPHLVRLLEQGKLPYTMVGEHLRVRFEDVVRYCEERDARTGKALAEMAEERDWGL